MKLQTEHWHTAEQTVTIPNSVHASVNNGKLILVSRSKVSMEHAVQELKLLGDRILVDINNTKVIGRND